MLAVSATMKISVEKQHSRSSPAPQLQTQNDGKSSLNGYSLRGRSPSGEGSRRPCRNYFTGNCMNLSCNLWHPSECQFYKKHNRHANSVKSAYSGSKRLTFSLKRSRRTRCRIPHNQVAYSRVLSCRNPKSILQKVTNPSDRSAACDSHKIHYATSEFRKEMVHRKV